MLDSSPRIPCSAQAEWEESSFTRPMRSPFVVEKESQSTVRTAPRVRTVAPPPPPESEVDVALEEAALFEPPTARMPALRRATTPPPRRSRKEPRYRDEDTMRHETPGWLLQALASERDSARIRAAARTGAVQVDLSKTVEEPTFEDE